MLIGDVTEGRAREAIERHFGFLMPTPARRGDVPAAAGAPTRVPLGAIQTRSVTRYAALPPLDPDPRAALEIAIALLRPAIIGDLRQRLGESVTVDFWYRPSERAGNVGMRVIAPDATHDEMDAAIGAALRKAQQSMGIAVGLETARIGLVAEHVRAMETLLGEALARADDAAGRIHRIAQVDAAMVRDGAERWLRELPVRIDTGAVAGPEHFAAARLNTLPRSDFPEVRRHLFAQGLPVMAASWPGVGTAAAWLTLRTPTACRQVPMRSRHSRRVRRRGRSRCRLG